MVKTKQKQSNIKYWLTPTIPRGPSIEQERLSGIGLKVQTAIEDRGRLSDRKSKDDLQKYERGCVGDE